jgi:tripartite-type tricarboxylate transporter receptor subunit TctC
MGGATDRLDVPRLGSIEASLGDAGNPAVFVTMEVVGFSRGRAVVVGGAVSYGSSGIGGAHHLSGAMFAHQAGLDMIHVPYKSGSNAATDLLAGHITSMFEMHYAALPSIEAGKIKAIAVTSSKPIELLPDVPTMAEAASLTGFESGTPPENVARLSRELRS